jgi:hypothetical protein
VSGLFRKAVIIVFIVKRDENSHYCDILYYTVIYYTAKRKKEEGRKERFPPGTDLNWHLPCTIKLLYSPHRTNCKHCRHVAINKINYHIAYNFHH